MFFIILIINYLKPSIFQINMTTVHNNLNINCPVYTENRLGNFMYRPIRWGCKPGPYSTARKIISICAAILLTLTGVGLFIVIPAIKEWRRQVKEINQNQDLNKSNKNSFIQELAKFNNYSVKGQINGIYITTNEKNLDATSQLLENHPRCEQTMHIGCATWHNFDIMCTRKSKYGLIIDFNPKNADFIRKTVDIIKASESRYVFKGSMISYLNSLKGKERELYFHPDQQGLPTSRIENELSRKGSWLASEENYLFIKELVSNDHLVAINETITNSQTFSKIRTCLDSNHVVVDTVYLSNICNFMSTNHDKQAFVKSIKQMLNKDTLFISCPRLKHLHSTATTILHQIPLLGKDILADNFNSTRLFEDTLVEN